MVGYILKKKQVEIAQLYKTHISAGCMTKSNPNHLLHKSVIQYTANGERFAGPNFRGFEENRESFSVNILHEHLFDIT